MQFSFTRVFGVGGSSLNWPREDVNICLDLGPLGEGPGVRELQGEKVILCVPHGHVRRPTETSQAIHEAVIKSQRADVDKATSRKLRPPDTPGQIGLRLTYKRIWISSGCELEKACGVCRVGRTDSAQDPGVGSPLFSVLQTRSLRLPWQNN